MAANTSATMPLLMHATTKVAEGKSTGQVKDLAVGLPSLALMLLSAIAYLVDCAATHFLCSHRKCCRVVCWH